MQQDKNAATATEISNFLLMIILKQVVVDDTIISAYKMWCTCLRRKRRASEMECTFVW
jgi:hypothetical protein